MFLKVSNLGQCCAHVCGDGRGGDPREEGTKRKPRVGALIVIFLVGTACSLSIVGNLEYRGHRDFCNCNWP